MLNQVLQVRSRVSPSIRLGTSLPRYLSVSPPDAIVGLGLRLHANSHKLTCTHKVILVIFFLTVWNHRNSKKRLFSNL